MGEVRLGVIPLERDSQQMKQIGDLIAEGRHVLN